MFLEFSAGLWEWRGPAPFYWLTLPDDGCDYVHAEAAAASVAPRGGRQANGTGRTC